MPKMASEIRKILKMALEDSEYVRPKWFHSQNVEPQSLIIISYKIDQALSLFVVHYEF